MKTFNSALSVFLKESRPDYPVLRSTLNLPDGGYLKGYSSTVLYTLQRIIDFFVYATDDVYYDAREDRKMRDCIDTLIRKSSTMFDYLNNQDLVNLWVYIYAHKDAGICRDSIEKLFIEITDKIKNCCNVPANINSMKIAFLESLDEYKDSDVHILKYEEVRDEIIKTINNFTDLTKTPKVVGGRVSYVKMETHHAALVHYLHYAVTSNYDARTNKILDGLENDYFGEFIIHQIDHFNNSHECVRNNFYTANTLAFRLAVLLTQENALDIIIQDADFAKKQSIVREFLKNIVSSIANKNAVSDFTDDPHDFFNSISSESNLRKSVYHILTSTGIILGLDHECCDEFITRIKQIYSDSGNLHIFEVMIEDALVNVYDKILLRFGHSVGYGDIATIPAALYKKHVGKEFQNWNGLNRILSAEGIENRGKELKTFIDNYESLFPESYLLKADDILKSYVQDESPIVEEDGMYIKVSEWYFSHAEHPVVDHVLHAKHATHDIDPNTYSSTLRCSYLQNSKFWDKITLEIFNAASSIIERVETVLNEYEELTGKHVGGQENILYTLREISFASGSRTLENAAISLMELSKMANSIRSSMAFFLGVRHTERIWESYFKRKTINGKSFTFINEDFYKEIPLELEFFIK
jgi:hypothetical protein